MLNLRNLRIQVQQRRSRLHRSTHEYYDAELLYTFQFLNKNAYTRNLLTTIESNTDVDFDEWVGQLGSAYGVGVQFPRTEAGKAKVCLGILRHCVAKDTNSNALGWARYFSDKSNFNENLSEFTSAVIDPLFNYLDDEIDEIGNVLYVIERFKLKAEWFKRSEFYSLYENDTSTGEKNLDRELRSYLFDGGIDYPFSEPGSPSGKADIVAMLGSEDPLVLEVKVFDPRRNRNKAHIRQGFHQALKYASDYNQDTGYLVIFNCSKNPLLVSQNETPVTEFPTRVFYASKSFFVIPIDINPDAESASKENPANRQNLDINDLTGVKL